MRQEKTQEEISEAIEHRDIILDVRAVLATNAGKNLFKYLFKHFEVAQSVPQGFEGMMLHEWLGFMRAGNSIFKLAAESDFIEASRLLAKIEKERYDAVYKDAQIG